MKNNSISNNLKLSIILVFCLLTLSCQKQNDWLDVKSSKTEVVPETLADFQAILDKASILNNLYSTAGQVGADNIYMTDIGFNAAPEDSRNLYIWKKEIWSTGASAMWNNYFKNIEYANVVLDGLVKIKSAGKEYDSIKGQAFFHRAIAYYSLVQLFCKAYNSNSSSELGLPIRLTSDVNLISQRSSLQDTYQQIISDAVEASTLLPETQTYIQRPIMAAAFALLAKSYLNMADYDKSKKHADKCISIRPQLLDYNNNTIVNLNSTYRFPTLAKNIPEVLFYAQNSLSGDVGASTSNRGLIPPDLYQSYENDDLRKTFFFATSGVEIKFRGPYTGSGNNFCGLAINEVYLIRAECNARQGNITAAMIDLNTLLIKRYKTGKFSPIGASDEYDALNIILNERRKELPFVGDLRWEDLKRLNKEPRFQRTLTRVISGITYTLPPNDNRYVLPIPSKEIQLTGLQQNER